MTGHTDEQVYAIDLLGFGRSDKPIMSYSTELWRDQVLDFLSEFVDGPAILVGNSIGSLISLMVGSYFMYRKLTLCFDYVQMCHAVL